MNLDEMQKCGELEGDEPVSLSEAQDLETLPTVATFCEDPLAAFPVVTTIPVLWSDEDAFGHVNNLTYLRWCENSRVEYLRRISMWTELPPRGVGPILASVKCDYKAQLKYPDTVSIGTRVGKIGNSSLQMEHIIVSQETNSVAAVIDSTIVLLDYQQGRPVTIPASFRRVIGDLEGCYFAMPETAEA